MNWAYINILVGLISPQPVHYCCHFGSVQQTRVIHECGNQKPLAIINGPRVEFRDSSLALEKVIAHEAGYSLLRISAKEVLVVCDKGT